MPIENDERSFKRHIAGQDDQIYDYLPSVESIGDFQRVEGIDVIINSIRTLLLTPLGFYPFDPEYGSLLYRKIFDPIDQISREEVEYEVRTRVETYDPRIEIEKVEIYKVTTDGKAYQVNVFIKRGEITGEVNVHLPGANYQFAFESEEGQ